MAGYAHNRLDTADRKPKPTELKVAEIVVNTVDNTLFSKRPDGTVISVGGSGGGQLLGDGKTKGVQYMSKDSSDTDDIIISSGTNGLIVDSFTLQDGATLTIEDNAVLKVV